MEIRSKFLWYNLIERKIYFTLNLNLSRVRGAFRFQSQTEHGITLRFFKSTLQVARATPLIRQYKMNSWFYLQINTNSISIEKSFKNIAVGSSFKNNKNKVSNECIPFPTMQCFLSVCVWNQSDLSQLRSLHSLECLQLLKQNKTKKASLMSSESYSD